MQMTRDDVPDTDHVSRYCRPGLVDDGKILPEAFRFRRGEGQLSVNWLEHLGAPDLESAVGVVRETFRLKGYVVKRNGVFAVLNVGAIKDAVRAVIGNAPRVEHLPLNDDASHAGISGYSAAEMAAAHVGHEGGGGGAVADYSIDEDEAANKVAMLVGPDDTYAGIVENKGAREHPPRRTP